MADLSEWLAAIDHALTQPRGQRGTVLTVTGPRVLGQKGKYLGRRSDGTPVYGLTKRQCRAIQHAIYEAAREEAVRPVPEDQWE